MLILKNLYIFVKKFYHKKLIIMISKNKLINVITDVLYLFFIFFFCYTAVNKILNLESFRINLMKTSLFNEDFAKIFSLIVIGLEFLIIILLLFFKKIGLIIFTLTILIFTTYISYLRFKGLYEICGCGGILNGLQYQYHLYINISLILGSFFCLYQCKFLNNEE